MNNLQPWHGSELVVSAEVDFVFLYKGYLLALNSDNVLFWADLEQVVHDAHSGGNQVLDLKTIYAYLVDNRGLDAEAFRQLTNFPGRNELRMVIDGASVAWRKVADLGRFLGSAEALDLNVYFDRVYIATTQGLWHIDVDFSNARLDHLNPVRRNDAYCLSSIAKYGCVMASCGEDGLFAGYDDFDRVHKRGSELEHLGGNSQRISWLRRDVLNYSEGKVEFYASTTVEGPDSSGGKMAYVTALRAGSELTSIFKRDSHVSYNTENETISVNVEGVLTFADRYYNSNWEHRLGSAAKEYSVRVGFPLQAYPLLGDKSDYDSYGTVLQTLEGIYEIRRTGVAKINSGVSVSLKTFPGSKRYRNIIAAVDDCSLHLYSPTPATAMHSIDQ